MDEATARELTAMTNAFYQQVAASFSATRQSAWQGWERVVETAVLDGCTEVDVLDAACGNLRFERFLAERVPTVRAWVVDNCEDLRGDAPCVTHYQHVDLATRPDDIDAPPCDLAVCFGFMHHLPLVGQRADLLRVLVDHTRPGGHVAISFWQFAKDPRLRAKATPVEGGEPGDYVLGWQGRADVRRYCHSFSEAEVDALADSVRPRAIECARFSADGKSGSLNRYLVLRVG